jgi:phage replication-related protein YjqB (UPF0714/DUF867 family)
MTGMDGATRFGRLLAEPGVVEHCELRSRFGFMAFHGGALERQTDRIARAAADASGASLYVVEHPPPEPAHFPSTDVRRDQSPVLHAFLDHVEVVVTIHGFGRQGLFTSLLLGGRNRQLAARLEAELTPALPGYQIITDLELIPRELRGLHPGNPVNVPALAGVQIELPPRARGLTPHWADWDGEGFVPPAAAIVDALARVAASWEPSREPS